MNLKVAIAGGGIGGLAAALAASRGGCLTSVFEKTSVFTETGAGVQLGPNVTRIFDSWGLLDSLHKVATAPERLKVRSAADASLLGELLLGPTIAARYGAPYLTVHRADLHSILLNAARQSAAVVQIDCNIQTFQQTAQAVLLQTSQGQMDADVLVGADGLWSNTRHQLLNDGLPRRTGHLAYRALVKQTDLPLALRSQNITAWLGPNMHAIQYPVRGADLLNVVVFTHGVVPDDFQNWNHAANAAHLKADFQGSCSELQDLLNAVPDWRLWVMHDRLPLNGGYHMAQGRVALLGDAAHPMRPYLAQGAGMAIEDAAELGLALTGAASPNVPNCLQQYAANRWKRNARVQARALRNGQIFHATGAARWGRDVSMKLMGQWLLDMPWLYGYRHTSPAKHAD